MCTNASTKKVNTHISNQKKKFFSKIFFPIIAKRERSGLKFSNEIMSNSSNNHTTQTSEETCKKNNGAHFIDGASKTAQAFFKPSPSTNANSHNNFLFDIIREAKDNSENPVGCIMNFYSIVSSSWLAIITLILIIGVPISMLAIGIIHIDNCPIEPKIPIWLIVFGIFGLINCCIRVISSIIIQLRFRHGTRVIYREPLGVFSILFTIGLFLLIWFCLGNAWVFSIHDKQQSSDSTRPETYCQQTCYDFAFWSIICFWVVISIFVILFLAVTLYLAVGYLISVVYNRKVKLSNDR